MGCAVHDDGARIVNALAISSGSSETLADSLECDGHTYKNEGGSFAVTGQLLGTVASAFIETDVHLPTPTNATSGDVLSEKNFFTCKFHADYAYNPETERLTGPGKISTCTDFECTWRLTKISCEDMKEALGRLQCDTPPAEIALPLRRHALQLNEGQSFERHLSAPSVRVLDKD